MIAALKYFIECTVINEVYGEKLEDIRKSESGVMQRNGRAPEWIAELFHLFCHAKSDESETV